jgi:hypothetical protein
LTGFGVSPKSPFLAAAGGVRTNRLSTKSKVEMHY